MDDQLNILDYFHKYKNLFDFYYGETSLSMDIEKIELKKYHDLLLKLKKSLENVDFGKINYNNKLFYLFVQYLIKEIDIINQMHDSKEFNNYLQNNYIERIILEFLFSSLLKKDILNLSYIELNSIFTKLLNEINSFDLIKYKFNIFQEKKLYYFFNNVIDLLTVMNNKIGGKLTPNEKKELTKKIKLIFNKLNKFKIDLLRNLMIGDHYELKIDFKGLGSVLKNNEYGSDIKILLEILELLRINCIDSLKKILEFYKPGKSIRDFYLDLNDKKLYSFLNKKKIIEFEILKMQSWLKEKKYFSNLEFYPVTIQKNTSNCVDWISDPYIELVYKKNSIKGIKIYLMDENVRENKKGFQLSEWRLKEWVRSKLIPGELFLSKLYPATQKTNYLTINKIYGQQRWNLIFKFILLKNGYFSESEEHFMGFFQIYYDLLLTIGVLDRYRGKNINDICLNINNLTGSDLIKCSYDLLKKQTNFHYKLIEIFDVINLIEIEEKIILDSMPLQRFFDILGKNSNFPFFILKKIYEKFYKINLENGNKDNFHYLFKIFS